MYTKTYGTKTIAGKKHYVIKDPLSVNEYPFYAYVRTVNAVKGKKKKMVTKVGNQVKSDNSTKVDKKVSVEKPKLSETEWEKEAADIFIKKVNALREKRD